MKSQTHSEDDPPSGEQDAESRIGRSAIRSFVLRQGRMSDAQHRAYAELSGQYRLEKYTTPLAFKAVFGREAPVILEIGSGMGETTAAIAAGRPEHDFLAVEVHTPGVAALMKRLSEAQLTNVRVVQQDAVAWMQAAIPPASLTGVHLYFPDPWPKKRHHKRRILNVGLLDHVAIALQRGGYFHMATDWEPYALESLATLSAHPAFLNTAEGFAPRPADRPVTKFEARGKRLGHGVWDLLFTRR
jgi:tRNA (guanine-N7-)-methyltransferase